MSSQVFYCFLFYNSASSPTIILPADWSSTAAPVTLTWAVSSLGHSCQAFGTPSVQLFVDDLIGDPSVQIVSLDTTAVSFILEDIVEGYSI